MKAFPEKRANHFCCGNKLLLLIKLKKIGNIFSSFTRNSSALSKQKMFSLAFLSG